MTQGSLPRSFKVIRVGLPADDHVGCRPSKINVSWVHMLGQNETNDTRKPPKKFKGNPTCARPNLQRTATWITVGRRRSKRNHPLVNFFSMQNLMCIRSDKMIPMTQGSLPRSFKAIRVGCPAVDHMDRRQSKINESWVHMQVKMKPMTQGYLPRSFKEIRLARGQIFDGRRRESPSVGDVQKSITHRKPPEKFQRDRSRSPGGRPRGSPSIKNQRVVGQLFFYAKSQVHMLGQNETYDTRKPPKKFQGNPICARPNL
ncbi:uncharacterized protein G2W53_026915 [Senna tora]|uniref:Uncharacterized protein n=1 Tax=Senna tora TaxID=362788 RepID=A0A834TGK0_9FABA|nr:uncharacterized protein G2W53_026915 [Senna tora]